MLFLRALLTILLRALLTILLRALLTILLRNFLRDFVIHLWKDSWETSLETLDNNHYELPLIHRTRFFSILVKCKIFRNHFNTWRIEYWHEAVYIRSDMIPFNFHCQEIRTVCKTEITINKSLNIPSEHSYRFQTITIWTHRTNWYEIFCVEIIQDEILQRVRIRECCSETFWDWWRRFIFANIIFRDTRTIILKSHQSHFRSSKCSYVLLATFQIREY